jgi:hypothetical protein
MPVFQTTRNLVVISSSLNVKKFHDGALGAKKNEMLLVVSSSLVDRVFEK